MVINRQPGGALHSIRELAASITGSIVGRGVGSGVFFAGSGVAVGSGLAMSGTGLGASHGFTMAMPMTIRTTAMTAKGRHEKAPTRSSLTGRTGVSSGSGGRLFKSKKSYARVRRVLDAGRFTITSI